MVWFSVPSRFFSKGEYPKVIRNLHRMMFGYERIVRMRGTYDQNGKHNGWALRLTDIPLSEHDKHFLREHGLPVPGKFKCQMLTCQARRIGRYGKA